MHIHILGICGTFMGGLALLAKRLGYEVSGSDQNVYPPMSDQLDSLGITLHQGYDYDPAELKPDLVVVGNAVSRGNPAVEAMLNRRLPYISGPQWLGDYLLKDRWVLAVAGTHGKTTTSSMLAWILDHAGKAPGFLIGGVPLNFGHSARLGESPFFVVEADEYDTAFFDKRSKFVHYRPRTVIINNLEFDHADIFDSLADIQRQFHHLLRTVPSEGQVIAPAHNENIAEVLNQGCWTPLAQTAIRRDPDAEWCAERQAADGSRFELYHHDELQGTVEWSLNGDHNIWNALSAIAAAHHAGISTEQAIAALGQFKNAKRRMETIATVDQITLYDDFAHHPTAIASTLQGLRHRVGAQRIIAIFEPRSNTMRQGHHAETLANAFDAADKTLIFMPDDLPWNLQQSPEQRQAIAIHASLESIIDWVVTNGRPDDQLVIMSNGGFGGLLQKLEQALSQRAG